MPSYSANLQFSTGEKAPLTSPYEVLVDFIDTGRYLFVPVPGIATTLSLCEVKVYGGQGERCVTMCAVLGTAPSDPPAHSFYIAPALINMIMGSTRLAASRRARVA